METFVAIVSAVIAVLSWWEARRSSRLAERSAEVAVRALDLEFKPDLRVELMGHTGSEMMIAFFNSGHPIEIADAGLTWRYEGDAPGSLPFLELISPKPVRLGRHEANHIYLSREVVEEDVFPALFRGRPTELQAYITTVMGERKYSRSKITVFRKKD